MKALQKNKRPSPGQQSLPWDSWQRPVDEIHDIAKQFVMVNVLNPAIANLQFSTEPKTESKLQEHIKILK